MIYYLFAIMPLILRSQWVFVNVDHKKRFVDGLEPENDSHQKWEQFSKIPA